MHFYHLPLEALENWDQEATPHFVTGASIHTDQAHWKVALWAPIAETPESSPAVAEWSEALPEWLNVWVSAQDARNSRISLSPPQVLDQRPLSSPSEVLRLSHDLFLTLHIEERSPIHDHLSP